MWFRYSRWDGSQDVSPFSADDLMDAMADDLISDGDLRSALQRIFRWGTQNPQGEHMKGVQDLLEQLRERKQQELNRYRLDSMLDDLEKRLNEVVQTEREGIQRRLEQARPGQSPNQSNQDQSGQDDGNSGDSDPRSSDQNSSGQDPSNSGRQTPAQASSQQSPSRSPGQSGQPGESQNAAPSGDSQSGDSSSELPPESLRRLLESMAQR
ncbi:MAG TPA: hypothetical protein VNG11_05935, partial [Chloroflexota bacterium]|nr:hypothetical protein [Chloroflexota bacterium]